MKVTNDELKNLQQAQLKIMDEIHRLCVDNNICYYMIGGTLLGAVRHGGFIPWDLDIDIAMPRDDYEKFAQISTSKMSTDFIYRDFKNTDCYTHPHALVCMKNTILTIRNEKYNPKEKNMGIYLDIFPLDKAPVDEKLQIKQAKKIQKLKMLKRYKRNYKFGRNNKFKELLKTVVSKAIFWTNLNKINKQFDDLCQKYNLCDSNLVCSMASHYSYKKQCMPFDIYGTPKLLKFEDREFFAPEQTETYLTRIYKDYMKLPPENERKANLDVFDEVIYDTSAQNS